MKIFDSVHGFIHFNTLEQELIDHPIFQRLHYIHQLGISYMVYPGGTHTRFEHSLGTMHLATRIFDQIAPKEDQEYFRQIIRFAALCHDLGHLPFSHVAERRLLGPVGHEEWTLKIIESTHLRPIWEKVEKAYPGKTVMMHVAKFALGEEKMSTLCPDVHFEGWESVYAQIIAGDFVGADRIDYLLRDAKATGLSYGLFDYMQLIETLVVLPEEGEGLVLGAQENGIESCEALLIARHFMQRRVYQYPAAKAYSFHMARFMEMFYKDQVHFSSVDAYLSMAEYDVLSAMKQAAKDIAAEGHIDAVCLFDRRRRFNAFNLPEQIGLDELSQFQDKNGIPSEEIHWDFGTKNSFKIGLSIPILCKNRSIAPASTFSEILIPQNKKNWLYLAPEYPFEL